MPIDGLDQILDQVNTIDLTSAERYLDRLRLAGLLWACEYSIRPRDKRELVLQGLPQDVQMVMKRDNTNDETDIELILETCLNYPPEGLKRLIKIVAVREGKSKQFEAVYDFLKSLLAKDAKIQKLTSLIAEMQLKNSDLEEIYRACVPSYSEDYWQYPRRLDTAQAFDWVLDRLKVAPVAQQSQGLPPLLTFVERLATYIKEKDSLEKLRAWVDNDAVPAWQVRAEAIAALRAKLAEEAARLAQSVKSTPPSLLILLEPVDERDPYKFYVKAWLYRSKEDNVNLYSPQNNQFFTSESISELLEELLEVEGELQASVMIEFFLPRALFCQKVDQWETAGTAETIGVRNSVIIRSSERLQVAYRRNDHFWKDRWRMIQSLEAGLAPIHLIYERAHYDGKQVYSKFLQDKTKVCLCLLLVPPSIDLGDKNEVFFKMLLAGIPVALWPRDLPNDQEKVEEIKGELLALLRNHKLSELPDLIRVKRAEADASGEERHLGHCFTLFWDDPTRMPPEDIKHQEPAIAIRK